MIKQIYLMIGIGVILVVGIISFWFLPIFMESQQSFKTGPTGVQVLDRTSSAEDKKENYKVDIKYPQIIGMKDSKTEEVINDFLNDKANKMQMDFIESLKDTKPPQVGRPGELVEIEKIQSQFIVKYKVAQATEKIISVQFMIIDSQPGMAHPYNYNDVFNYEVVKKKEIDLGDLFKENSDYLDVLSEKAKKDLLNQQKENPNAADFVNEGAAPDAKNYKLFTVAPKDLVIIFDPATVAPDYFGTMKVAIPLSDLSDILISN